MPVAGRVQMARARFERGPGSGLAQVEELGSIIRHELPTGPLFVYGNGAEVYLLADRSPATVYLNAEAWRSTAPGAQQTRAGLVGTLRSDPPPVIVLAPHSDEAELNLAEYPSMRTFLQECYVRRRTTPNIDVSWTILVRNAVCGVTLVKLEADSPISTAHPG
jgi:hypothetical protein